MFEVGDKISYPMHGAGVISSIENMTILGEEHKYYILRFLVGRMTSMIPISSAEDVGLRAIIDPDAYQRVISYMLEDVCEESDNWNQRYRDNMDKLRTGNIFDVADVVKCLVKRDHEKGLSAGERKMFLTARQVLLTELSVAGGKTVDELANLIGC